MINAIGPVKKTQINHIKKCCLLILFFRYSSVKYESIKIINKYIPTINS